KTRHHNYHKKEARHKIQAPNPTIGRGDDLYAVGFDGSARGKRGGGAYSVNVRKLLEWRVLKARSGYAESLTVNEAEYHGLLLCLNLLEDLDPRRLDLCGDSNLVIRQVRGDIDYKTPGLWIDYELDQIMSCCMSNEIGMGLASTALQQQCGIVVESEKEIQDLVTLNRLDEILVGKIEDEAAWISAVTTRSKDRSGLRTGSALVSLREEVVRELQIERIQQAQDEESWISGLKKYLVGDLTHEDARVLGSMAMYYEVDQSDLLFYCPSTKEAAADRNKLMRLVIPETLQQDILHHYYTSLEHGHQGIGRIFDRIPDHFHWRRLYKSVQRYVGESVDCETGKGRPQIQDIFSGYVITKASASRSAQTIAKTYEECVFRRFGAREVT
ncbi:LOW QUALITY PROTEIN: reverse transcriptase, partial [Phytophthora megakarya]